MAKSVTDYAKEQAAGDGRGGGLHANRGAMEDRQMKDAAERLREEKDPVRRASLASDLKKYQDQKQTHDDAGRAFKGAKDGYQTGKLGVDLALNTNGLRTQERLTQTANRQANGRQVLEVGGVWIDDGFKPGMPTLVVKAQSAAYFRILEKQPAMKEVYRLGNFLVWVAPNKTALVIDQNDGKEELADDAIASLFVATK